MTAVSEADGAEWMSNQRNNEQVRHVYEMIKEAVLPYRNAKDLDGKTLAQIRKVTIAVMVVGHAVGAFPACVDPSDFDATKVELTDDPHFRINVRFPDGMGPLFRRVIGVPR